MFMHNMLIRPSEEDLAQFGTPDFTIFNAGAFPCNRCALMPLFSEAHGKLPVADYTPLHSKRQAQVTGVGPVNTCWQSGRRTVSSQSSHMLP